MLLRHINYFLAVAEHQSFTRAAQALHVSQPALSQQIRQLEAHLGAALFDRSGRSIRLTDAGVVYLDYARRTLQGLEEGKRAIHDVADLRRGLLRIAVTPTFSSWLIGPLLAAFYQRYPDINVSIREMAQERIEEQLCAGELDAGIGFAGGYAQEIEAQVLLRETLVLVVGSGHPLGEHASLPLEVLDALPLVLLSTEFATRGQIDRCCWQNGLSPRVVMEANSVNAVVEIIRCAPLATLLPAAIARENTLLTGVTLEPPLLERTAVILQHRDSYQSAAARAFIQLALQWATLSGPLPS
ncbi:transcriptional regulator CynR [Pantoea coffeiphila]|uniref:Transcriptional regulator CynR n=1 Tax=Pantoea coffeiphila TaxID=1465635 RepID=A0A2S9ICI1_9GAMM|nr:transcriptional regulator CynR [Pantoea coffeiphila]PRD15492.1 transcriptional regulator CynR [Pantoea coffeiphila]